MILTASFSGDKKISEMHGTTLSSVSSLTVYPDPILQFNIQIPSATSKFMHENKYLALHILSPSKESVKLARNFSLGSRYINKKLQAQNTNNQEQYGSNKTKHTTPFERINKDEWDLFENVIKNERPDVFHIESDLHLPILTKHSERILICEKYKVFEVSNHEIWTCKVKDILVNVHEDSKTGGLLYFNRKFHHVGEALVEHKKESD
jgi:flavin reductase (DIM6/NTAB) family NADH-FMN oxidoreductase RutF